MVGAQGMLADLNGANIVRLRLCKFFLRLRDESHRKQGLDEMGVSVSPIPFADGESSLPKLLCLVKRFLRKKQRGQII